MARERANDFETSRRVVVGIIAALFREQLTHREFLDRCELLFASAAYQRLTQVNSAHLRGMLFGATESAHALFDWCHWVDGAFMPSAEFQATGRPYTDIDSDLSRHVWPGTQKPFAP